MDEVHRLDDGFTILHLRCCFQFRQNVGYARVGVYAPVRLSVRVRVSGCGYVCVRANDSKFLQTEKMRKEWI